MLWYFVHNNNIIQSLSDQQLCPVITLDRINLFYVGSSFTTYRMQCISTGKRRCINDAGHILRVLSDLLGHENQEASTFYLSIAAHSVCHILSLYVMMVSCMCQKRDVNLLVSRNL